MNRTKLTLQHRMLRRARYWHDRRATASTEEALAVVAWDQVRGAIHDLPVQERDTAWMAVTEALDRVGCQFDTHVDTPQRGSTHSRAHARTRGAEPNTSTRRRGR